MKQKDRKWSHVKKNIIKKQGNNDNHFILLKTIIIALSSLKKMCAQLKYLVL